MDLANVVPWGRSFDEYRRMFALTDEELELRVLGCADGPASFNAQATRRGSRVISCDPIYQYGADQIRERIADSYDEILDRTRRNLDAFVWDVIHSVDELGETRLAAMNEFLDDYDEGRLEGRYVAAALPALPFRSGSFDLALCSHFLFLYTIQLGGEFHGAAVREMCRVASEVRIFPLLALDGGRSPFVDQIEHELRAVDFVVSIEQVPYEFQRGGNQMMRIRRDTPGRNTGAALT
jgi:hypothetical protein